MWSDITITVTGSEIYPFIPGFPSIERRLSLFDQKLLREHYVSVYGNRVTDFPDERRLVVVHGSGFICREPFSTSRGVSDRSSFILFKDGEGHLCPAKVIPLLEP
jgi:ATP-dependent RNA circularization protein (DNA/RNA ligase family)